MVNSREILLKLVRIAMGWENDFSLPINVDWKEVLVLSHEQGVNAIALDGLEVVMQNNPQFQLSTTDKLLIIEAIGGLQMVEVNNQNQLEALKELASILHKNHIPFMVMKGFACGQYYPNPKHRPCGDIDIYPGEKYKESYQAFVDEGIVSDPYYYRHSALFIKNVMIENHKVLGDLRGPKKQSKELEEWLKREAIKSIDTCPTATILNKEIIGAVFPSANFNALFLPWHVSAHFAFERVTLRHLLDWALFLENDGMNIDIDAFREAKKRFTFGFSKMADILTNLSLRFLRIPDGVIPLDIIKGALNINYELADKVMDYMFIGKPRERDNNVWKFRWNNIKQIWKERWKYSDVFNMSMVEFITRKSVGVIFKIGEHD